MNIDTTNYMDVSPDGPDTEMIRRAGQIAANEAMRLLRRERGLMEELYVDPPRNMERRRSLVSLWPQERELVTTMEARQAAQNFQYACERRLGIDRFQRGPDGEVFGAPRSHDGRMRNLWGEVRGPEQPVASWERR